MGHTQGGHGGTYRYVAWPDVPEWQAKGWEVIGEMPGHHSHWSAIMKWAGEGELELVETNDRLTSN
jgi:hypothetical protein